MLYLPLGTAIFNAHSLRGSATTEALNQGVSIRYFRNWQIGLRRVVLHDFIISLDLMSHLVMQSYQLTILDIYNL
jgi:hypothetical protein